MKQLGCNFMQGRLERSEAVICETKMTCPNVGSHVYCSVCSVKCGGDQCSLRLEEMMLKVVYV